MTPGPTRDTPARQARRHAEVLRAIKPLPHRRHVLQRPARRYEWKSLPPSWVCFRHYIVNDSWTCIDDETDMGRVAGCHSTQDITRNKQMLAALLENEGFKRGG